MRTVDFEPIRRFLDEHEAQVAPLERREALACWTFATAASEQAASEREATEIALRRVYASRERYEQVRRILWSLENDCDPAAVDPLLGRRVTLAFLAYLEGRREERLLEEATRRETALEGTFHNFRARLGAREASENDIRRILKEETDERSRREAWEASKAIGEVAAPQILELVKLRNTVAQAIGYADYFALALEVSEIDEGRLFGLLGEVAARTEGPYLDMKRDLDARLAWRFGLASGVLAPWHYSDPFFQEAPSDGTIDLDRPYRGADLADLSRRFFEGVGMDVADVLDRSDLEPRPGKCQHAFCLSVDRGADIRVLSNNEPTAHWAGTMLHELGHAAYDKYLDPALPWDLKIPAHAFATEAVAQIFGRLDLDPYFLAEVVGVERDEVSRMAPALRETARVAALVFVRWALVVVRFERELYRDPGGDHDARWWDLVERIQGVRRPAGRRHADWAAKIHLATDPAYYHNYILGELLSSQLEEAIRAATGRKTIVGDPEAGRFMIERVFRPGARHPWEDLVRRATGKSLGVGSFLARVAALR